MSETHAAGGRSRKATCRNCNRTVILAEIDGRKVDMDPELINVVPFNGKAIAMLARRVHADMCQRYQIEAERAKLRASALAARPGIKRPRPGKREPGQ
jgi:hypothetical protein